MRPTDTPLLEQMQIHDFEIESRKALLNISDADVMNLTRCRDFVIRDLGAIVEKFCESFANHEEVAFRIGDAETLYELKELQKKHVKDIFCGFYDYSYAGNRARLGLFYKRLGIEPKYHLAAVKTLKEILSEVILRNLGEGAELTQVLSALEKILYFDMTYALEAYVKSLRLEITAAKKRAEDYAASLEQKVASRTRDLEELARKDPLTNLYNHRAFQEFIRRDLAYAERTKSPLSLACLDVDDFKSINDQYGHGRGDEVLRSLAGILTAVARESDICSRYGGDEFCLILPGTTEEQAERFCQRVTSALASMPGFGSVSIGIAQTGPEQFVGVEELIWQADQALYRAKRESGFQIVRASALSLADVLSMEAGLDQALSGEPACR